MTPAPNKGSDRKAAYGLFRESLDLAPGQRIRFIEERASDPKIAQEARALLIEHESVSGDSPLVDLPKPPASVPSFAEVGDSTPEHIGPYRIVERIGAGGMGEVFAGVRDLGGIRQRIAIKLLAPARAGLPGQDLRERFEIERHVLSALDHPNIARFIDAGETGDGQPYFVMQLIEGIPIDEYCDRNNLSIEERLTLFRKVCGAVHAAHTNLVVHRDLKPSNILVTPHGEPILLDFGIAKLLNPVLVGSEAVTGPAIRLMTPEYASPEQVRGDPVTTLSDVYSLGVLLYQLLTGHRPYRIATRLQEEIVRIICDTEPERPSTALTRSEPVVESDGGVDSLSADVIARHRSTKPNTLRRQLSGDLDAIILMALSKTPSRRYASAKELDDDLDAYLRGYPVAARRMRRRVGYVLRKSIGRHPAATSAIVAVLLALFLGGALTTWQWRVAEAARAREQAIRDAFFEQSQDLLKKVYQEVVGLPGALDARVAIVDASRDALESIETDDRKPSELLGLLAQAYESTGAIAGDPRSANVGDLEEALEFYRQALGLREQALARDPDNAHRIQDVAETLLRIADCEYVGGDWSGALDYFQEAQARLESIDGPTRRDVRARAMLYSTIDKIGEMHLAYGDLAQAGVCFLRAQELRLAVVEITSGSAPARRNLATGMTQLALLRLEQHQVDEAEALIDKAVTIHRKNLSDDPENASYARNLANALTMISEVQRLDGNLAAAEASATEALGVITRVLDQESGAKEIDVRHIESQVGASYALGLAQAQSGALTSAFAELASAERRARQLVALSPLAEDAQALLGRVLSSYGALMAREGQLVAARERLEEARSIVRRLAESNPRVVSRQRDLAVTLTQSADQIVRDSSVEDGEGPLHQALGWYREAIEIRDALSSRHLIDPATAAELEGLDDRIATLELTLNSAQ